MANKQRFFDPVESTNSESTNSEPNRSESVNSQSSLESTIPQIDPLASQDYQQFLESITAILGPVPTVLNLYNKFKRNDDKLLLAVDYYLQSLNQTPVYTDTTTSRAKSYKGTSIKVIPPILLENNPKRKRTRGVQIPFAYAKRSNTNTQNPQGSDLAVQTWKRYLGTLYTDAFATRPYLRPLLFGKPLIIRLLKPKKTVGREKKHHDLAIIRLYVNDNNDEREIGKIKEQLSRILAPLIEDEVVELETSIMMETKTRLSTGDEFYIKIDVYLTHKSFTSNKRDFDGVNLVHKSDKLKFNFASETKEESRLRSRQLAVNKLFKKLQIRPIKRNGDLEVVSDDDDPESITDTETIETIEASQELNLDQLQAFYSGNQQSEMLKALPDSITPPTNNFRMELRPYQKQGLAWLLAREREFEVLNQLTTEPVNIKAMDEGIMNPLWTTFKWPRDKSRDYDSQYFYGNLNSGELSLIPPLVKSTVKGGILADEMGLGKTISALSLINSVPYDNNGNQEDSGYAFRTTLVIVPMSLLSQWEKEFHRANNNPNHRCIVYYGQQSIVDLSQKLLRTKHIPIMVLTTYGTVLSEYSKIASRRDELGNLPLTGLFSVKFFRIILDEGHNIRNRTAKTARAIFELKLSRKWVLTGTPVINRLDDIYSLVKFLELEPWNNFSYWKAFITVPFEQKKIKETLDVVKTILEPMFLRRTKDMKDKYGNALVELPPKEVIIEHVKFNDVEMKLYTWFKQRASRSFKESLNKGELLKQYTQILTHILRLRQVCCHADLIGHVSNDMDLEEEPVNDAEVELFCNEVKQQTVDKFANDTEINQVKYSLYELVSKMIDNCECSICTNVIARSEMVITVCGHMFCLGCLMDHFDFQANNKQPTTCPNCRKSISKYKLFKVRNRPTTRAEFKFHTHKTINKDFSFQLYWYDPGKTSSKVQALMKHINTLRDQPSGPIIVFSQFSSFLDIIENEILLQVGEEHVTCLKFDGRLKLNEREKILQEFDNYQHTPHKLTILLLSLKAGGVGLNLTNASRAFMMDPWWSPSVEEQAIDRLHRIGQDKHVKVVRFIMEDTIEIKMLQIQERKKQIGDIVGVEEEEKRKRRIQEIQLLFEE